MLAYVVLRGGGNLRTGGKPPTLDGRPLPCHMPIPGFEPGPQRWQAVALPLRYPGTSAYFFCIDFAISDLVRRVETFSA